MFGHRGMQPVDDADTGCHSMLNFLKPCRRECASGGGDADGEHIGLVDQGGFDGFYDGNSPVGCRSGLEGLAHDTDNQLPQRSGLGC